MKRHGMRRRVADVLVTVCMVIFLLAGCWDYQGLGEQAVVAGIAVDIGEEGRGYKLTFELVDVNGAQDGQFGSILLTTTGETLAQAAYDAHNKLHGPVYLGAADVVIVGRQAAEQVGLSPLVDYLIRNKNARNSLRIVVAETDTAAELFAPVAKEAEGEEEQDPQQDPNADILLSKALGQSLGPRGRQNRMTADARALYEIYHILHRGTSDLVLPIVGTSEAEDIPFQLDGLALFNGDRMTGTLDEADVPLYLLATAGLRDWAFPVMLSEQPEKQAILSVRHSRSRLGVGTEGGAPQFFLDIQVTVDVVQWPEGAEEPNGKTLRQMEAGAAQALSRQVLALCHRLRDEGRDILGLAEALRTQSPGLWEQIAGDWRAWLKAGEIDVRVEVQIQSAGWR